MTVTASQLRQNIYRILDGVAETGTPVEIRRKGNILKIITSRGRGKIANLKRRTALRCPPEEIVHQDWSGEWRK
jgi:hypothetical protein